MTQNYTWIEIISCDSESADLHALDADWWERHRGADLHHRVRHQLPRLLPPLDDLDRSTAIRITLLGDALLRLDRNLVSFFPQCSFRGQVTTSSNWQPSRSICASSQ